MTPTDLAWESRWKAVRPTAEYHAAYGFESVWRLNADDWKYPLEDTEQDVEYNGATVKARTFSGVGLVVWTPGGAQIVGWPQQ